MVPFCRMMWELIGWLSVATCFDTFSALGAKIQVLALVYPLLVAQST